MSKGTYPWLFVTQIFHNGQTSHGDDRKTFEVMTSTWPIRTLGSVASLLAATLYQGNPDRIHMLWNIVSTEIYTPYEGAAGMLLHINEKFTIGKLKLLVLLTNSYTWLPIGSLYVKTTETFTIWNKTIHKWLIYFDMKLYTAVSVTSSVVCLK